MAPNDPTSDPSSDHVSDYLIVGGGMTAAAAALEIRERDPDATVAIVSDEPDPPYARPPLSKDLLTDADPEPSELEYDLGGVELRLERRVRDLDPDAREVRDERGDVHRYDRLLLATGGRPRTLPFGDPDILYYRTRRHFAALRELEAGHDRFAVIGGGFIGAEVAAGLAMRGNEVVMVIPEAGVLAARLPPELREYVNDRYRAGGVRLVTGDRAAALRRNGTLELETEGGAVLEVDGVVAGIGIEPNTELAESAGLEVDDGVVVDARLRTSAEGVWAAGDVARFEAPALGSVRVEHEDAALSMGRAAGASMAGAAPDDGGAYRDLPFFYSDMFDLGYEAVGRLDADLETIADWRGDEEPQDAGVIAYLEEGRPVGVLLWNVFGAVDDARRLVEAGDPVDAALRDVGG